ncbi:MAG: Gfo/Idh/MocA family oxidoreductase, partial [Candidatus Sumerlaeota bacterium]|nr:Gfo/Idh/MocA family oxidoreductase [Candidatus Sumerlaeota bacterium]
MPPIQFGIVGGGWRAAFSLRIARACPERFQIPGMVVRTEEKGRAIEKAWGVPTFRTLEDMLARATPRFVLSSVPWPANPPILKELVQRGIPALSETPPASTRADMIDLNEFVQKHNGKVQVAEQYHLQP